MKPVSWLVLFSGLALTLGCGGSGDEGPEVLPVTGIVTLNSEPLADADIKLFPIGDTPGVGGFARTDAEGKFELQYNRGGQGAPAGEYRVQVSRRMMPDGSPVPADDDTPPIESPATETLPRMYSDPNNSQLTTTVTESETPITLELTTK
ncbi:DUF4198 domain-containing protein [Thalassoroseus pseudoceratinae]|uniref:DUF4198 domain-containing protein n=1 Tax=Thalassoroseus pseudoceratinae TaxID=2713176 RepID=UPI00141FBD7F|nr:DUF4198 domain-containing protein [Thalassoroseus pseudoceratinae]